MNIEELRLKLKGSPMLKKALDWLIMNQRDARPRWYVRLLAPLYQHRGRGSKIYRSVRMGPRLEDIPLRPHGHPALSLLLSGTEERDRVI